MYKLFKNTAFIGKKALYLPTCHSTNETAASLLVGNKHINGSVIYTDYQSKGKGQRGNSWESESGKNITLSVILNTAFLDIKNHYYLTIITSLAIHEFLRDYLKHSLYIKWPNDIVCQNSKIAGILIENYIRSSSIEWCIVGIGLNINQTEFETEGAVSLANICNQKFDRQELMELMLRKIEHYYDRLKREELFGLKKEYLQHLYWKDEVHVFQSEGTYFNGRILGISEQGKLHMELEDGERYFDLKEVKFIK